MQLGTDNMLSMTFGKWEALVERITPESLWALCIEVIALNTTTLLAALLLIDDTMFGVIV